jgi:hypothetical protein
MLSGPFLERLCLKGTKKKFTFQGYLSVKNIFEWFFFKINGFFLYAILNWVVIFKTHYHNFILLFCSQQFIMNHKVVGKQQKSGPLIMKKKNACWKIIKTHYEHTKKGKRLFLCVCVFFYFLFTIVLKVLVLCEENLNFIP